MRKTKKNWSILFISVLVLSIFLMGCGNKEGAKKDPAIKDESVKINVLTQSVEPTDLLEKFYKKHPNIKVEWEQVDTDNISQVLRTRLAAGGEDLDIISPQRSDFKTLVEAEAFLDISDQDFLNNYETAAVKSGSIDGKVFGLPLTQQTYLIWYNKDIFAKYNLEVPTNWDEFMEVSAVLKENGIAPIALGGKEEWILNVFTGLPYSGLFSEEPNWIAKASEGKVKWTDKGSIDALKKIQTLNDKGYILEGALGTGYDQAYQAFYQGKAAMEVNGAWSIDLLINTAPEFEVGAFVPPGNSKDTETKVAYIPGNLISVAKNSKNQEAALTFLKFLSEPENASEFTSLIKQFSSVKGAKADFHPATKLVEPTFVNEKTQMMHAELSTNVNSVFGAAIQKLLSGEATPEEVAKELQAAQEKDIK